MTTVADGLEDASERSNVFLEVHHQILIACILIPWDTDEDLMERLLFSFDWQIDFDFYRFLFKLKLRRLVSGLLALFLPLLHAQRVRTEYGQAQNSEVSVMLDRFCVEAENKRGVIHLGHKDRERIDIEADDPQAVRQIL